MTSGPPPKNLFGAILGPATRLWLPLLLVLFAVVLGAEGTTLTQDPVTHKVILDTSSEVITVQIKWQNKNITLINTNYMMQIAYNFSKVLVGLSTGDVMSKQLLDVVYSTSDTTTAYLSTEAAVEVYDLIQDITL